MLSDNNTKDGKLAIGTRSRGSIPSGAIPSGSSSEEVAAWRRGGGCQMTEPMAIEREEREKERECVGMSERTRTLEALGTVPQELNTSTTMAD